MLPDEFHTPRLDLRPVAPEDAGSIFTTYAQDYEVTRLLTWRPHQNLEETEAYIAHCIAVPPDIARTFVMVDRETQVIRGALDIRRVHPHRLELGYVLARACWGHGLMTEALTQVAAWALVEPAVFRIGAVCDVGNTRSARVLEKAGLIREGVLRRWLIHPNVSDEPRDCYSYGRVR